MSHKREVKESHAAREPRFGHRCNTHLHRCKRIGNFGLSQAFERLVIKYFL